MPVVSQAQNGAMHSAAEGKSNLGIPAKIGREFIADQAPGSVKALPKHVKSAKKKVNRLRKAGMISDRAAKKMPERWGKADDVNAATA